MKYSALSIIFLIFAVSGIAQQVFNFEGETLRYNAKYEPLAILCFGLDQSKEKAADS